MSLCNFWPNFDGHFKVSLVFGFLWKLILRILKIILDWYSTVKKCIVVTFFSLKGVSIRLDFFFLPSLTIIVLYYYTFIPKRKSFRKKN